MLAALYAVFLILFFFGLTVFVHELGHYLVARWCGLDIDAFSIGLGPALWKKKYKDTVYKIGILPFGGYVALPQMDPNGSVPVDKEGKERRLPRVSPPRKIAVAMAGVICNMILALALASIIYIVGKPSEPHETSAVVGYVDKESTAYGSGLRPGDEILRVNDRPVANWNDILTETTLGNSNVLVAYRSGADERTAVLHTVGLMGIQALEGVSWVTYCTVGKTMKGSSAEKAGLKTGDRIIEFGGQRVFSRGHLAALADEYRDQSVVARIERKMSAFTDEKEVMEMNLMPSWNESAKRALIGIQFMQFDMDVKDRVHPTPGRQIRQFSGAIFRILKALITPKEAKKAAGALGGPIAIMEAYWWAIKSSIMIAIWFSVFLNVNLAILNLLPIPILDGGHIVFSLWEWITRRPIHPKFMAVVTNIFFVLIIAAFITLSYRDVRRITDHRKAAKTMEEKRQAITDTNAVQSEAAPAE